MFRAMNPCLLSLGPFVLLSSLLLGADSSAPFRLTAPREIAAGEDATFGVSASAASTGEVTFELKTYSGAPLWTQTAPFVSGKASAVLKADHAASLEKGNRVLVATTVGREGAALYAPVRLRGRVFRNPREPLADLRPGDELVFTDLARLQPADSLSEKSAPGKWWRRTYRVPGDPAEHALVCVEAHDLDDPASCLAGRLTLPLNVRGWYEVWVRTLRPEAGGGIDVRLSGEPYFLRANPLQIDRLPGYAQPPFGALVDVRYRAADLTGQDLVFQQPYGTYESEQKRCSASLAGVRLVKLSESEVEAIENHAARKNSRTIGYDDDGFSYFFRWGIHDPVLQ